MSFTGAALPFLRSETAPLAAQCTVQSREETGLERLWAEETEGPQRIFARGRTPTGPFLTVEHDGPRGYCLTAQGCGRHIVSPGGTEVLSAFSASNPIGSARLWTSQVVPLVSTLQGFEVLHAGGVVIQDRLLALTAPSGTGKSSTIVHLLRAGAAFFADDVLALEPTTSSIVCHPGPELLNLDSDQLRDLAGLDEIGSVVGRSDKVHVRPSGALQARPLSALCLLRRSSEGTGVRFLPLQSPPEQLLGSAYLPYLTSSARLARQFEIAGTVASDVRTIEAHIGRDADARAVAAALRTWFLDGTAARLPVTSKT